MCRGEAIGESWTRKGNRVELERGAVGKGRKEQIEKTRLCSLAKVSFFHKEGKYSRERKDGARRCDQEV